MPRVRLPLVQRVDHHGRHSVSIHRHADHERLTADLTVLDVLLHSAARLVDAGHEVVGVHLALARAEPVTGRSRGCCTLDDARDARRVADMLDIPYYVWDFSTEFAADVIDDFLAEYRANKTPNPCVRCNEHIKFRAVLDRALALGFDAVATGHYARIVTGPDGAELHRAVDPDKDQSYVLAVVEQDLLSRCLFPLGESMKTEVRAEAETREIGRAHV